MTAREKYLAWIEAYQRDHIVQFLLKLNNKTDMDLIQALVEAKNKNGFMKYCMRYYLAHDTVQHFIDETGATRKLPNSQSVMPPSERMKINTSSYGFDDSDVPGDPKYDPEKDPYFAEKKRDPYSLDKKYHI